MADFGDDLFDVFDEAPEDVEIIPQVPKEAEASSSDIK